MLLRTLLLGNIANELFIVVNDVYRYEQYVEDCYIEFLKEKNRPEEVRIHNYI